jgi:hypothetical protein
MIDIPYVQLEPAAEWDILPAVYLSQTGQTWPHLMTSSLSGGVAIQVCGKQRARSDQAHVGPEHVPELGELIGARPPQQAPEPRQALGIGEWLPICPARLMHGAELEHRERPCSVSRPDLAKQHRTSHRHANGRRYDHEERREDQQRYSCADYVDRAFKHPRPGHTALLL